MKRIQIFVVMALALTLSVSYSLSAQSQSFKLGQWAEIHNAILKELNRSYVDSLPVDRIMRAGVDAMLDGMMDTGLQLVVLGKGDAGYENFFRMAQERYPGRVSAQITYSDKLSVTCTAYSCEGYTGITATGTVARVGAVAVVPRYIPLGTKMYIVSTDGDYVYGYCVAEDIGGAIKGRIVDLYFNTSEECWTFGRRAVKIYILE